MNAMQKKLGKICTFDCQMKQHEIIVTPLWSHSTGSRSSIKSCENAVFTCCSLSFFLHLGRVLRGHSSLTGGVEFRGQQELDT